MKRNIFLTLILLSLTGNIFAEGVTLTLEEAVTIALRDNRQVRLKAEDIKKAQARLAEEKSALFPTVIFTGGWTDYRGLYNKDMGQTSTQFSAKQNLYRGGKTVNSIARANYNTQAAQALLEKEKLEIALSVQKAFYTLLLSGEYVSLNQDISQNTQAHLALGEARFASGEASESEILQLKESLAAVEEAYQASLNQREASLAILRNLLHLDDKVEVVPQGKISFEPKDVAYDEGFIKAMQARPEIKQLEAQELAARKSVEIAKADSRPTISASWDYYSRSHAAGVLNAVAKNWNDYNTIGLSFSWPLFDGWQAKHKVEQAIVDLQEVRLGREKSYKDIALEVKNSYLALKNAIAGLKSAEAQRQVYADTLKTVQEKQTKGLASSLEVDDASLGKKVAEFNYTQAAYDYIIAKVSFEKATGGLL